MPGGKQERRVSRPLFFCIYDNPNGDTTRAIARVVSLLLQKKCAGILAPGRAHSTNSVCLLLLQKNAYVY